MMASSRALRARGFAILLGPILVELMVLTVCLANTTPAPVAPRDSTVDSVFGTRIPDPYRWMEAQKTPRLPNGCWRRHPRAERSSMRLPRCRMACPAHRGQCRNDDQPRPAQGGRRIFFLTCGVRQAGVLRVRLGDGSEKVLFDPQCGWPVRRMRRLPGTPCHPTAGQWPSISTAGAMRSRKIEFFM